jgi:hypothetical protein
VPGQSGIAIRKNELYAIARRVIEKQLYLLRLGNDGHLVLDAMLQERSLVRCAVHTLQRHVIKRREDVWNLPFRQIGFRQVENVRVSGIKPVPEPLKGWAEPGAETDNVDVEIP